jgi:hypothetical protein
MEFCINTISEFMKDNQSNFEEILSTLVINNTLPVELRSIAWRIFLGILPREKSANELVQITKNKRVEFEKLNSHTEIELFSKVIRKEEDISILPEGNLSQSYLLVQAELNRISSNNDFLKSQIVAETLLRLFVIWKKNNENENSDVMANLHKFYILAEVIYSLYPTILHFNIAHEDFSENKIIDAKFLFYFLNQEESFDADAYVIFDHLIQKILNEVNFNNLKQNCQIKELIHKHIIDNQNLLPLSEESKSFISNLGRIEKISYLYLNIVNPNLSKHLNSIKLDPYDVVNIWFSSLLAGSISFENLTYIWDNIFFFTSNDSFRLFDFVAVSLINNISTQLMAGDIDSCRSLLMKYRENSLDLKEIIKKSLKLKEKLGEIMV